MLFRSIGPVAYRLELPLEMSRIHNVFHVSMLRKYVSDPSHVLEAPSIELNEDLSFEVQSVGIVDQEIKELRNKVIPIVKVLWKSDTVEEMTFEEIPSLSLLYLVSTNFEDKFFLSRVECNTCIFFLFDLNG